MSILGPRPTAEDVSAASHELLINMAVYEGQLRATGQTADADQVNEKHADLVEALLHADAQALQDDLAALNTTAAAHLKTVTDNMDGTTKALAQDAATVAWVLGLASRLIEAFLALGTGNLATAVEALWNQLNTKP